MEDNYFTKIMLSVAASLITAGVVGLVAMSGQLSRIDERVQGLDARVGVLIKTNADRLETAAKQIDVITKEQRDSDRRIGVLEGRLRVN